MKTHWVTGVVWVLVAGCATSQNPPTEQSGQPSVVTSTTPRASAPPLVSATTMLPDQDFNVSDFPPVDPTEELVRQRAKHSAASALALAEDYAREHRIDLRGFYVADVKAEMAPGRVIFWFVELRRNGVTDLREGDIFSFMIDDGSGTTGKQPDMFALKHALAGALPSANLPELEELTHYPPPRHQPKSFADAAASIKRSPQAPVAAPPKPSATAAPETGPLHDVKDTALLDREIALFNRDPELYLQRGELLASKGFNAEAIPDFDKAIALGRPAVGYLERGRAKAAMNNFTAALPDLKAAIEYDRTNADAYYLRGVTYHHLENYSAAVADYDRALAFRPRDPAALDARGKAKSMLGDDASGLKDVSAAIELAPVEAQYVGDRADIEAKMHDNSTAITDYTRAIKLDPRVPRFWVQRAQAYFALSDFEHARADADHGLVLAPHDVDGLLVRGRAHVARKEFAEAIRDLDEVVALRPQNAVAYQNRAYAKREMSDFDGALADCDRAIYLSADDPDLYGLRALVHANKNDKAAAFADADRALFFAPDRERLVVTRARIHAQFQDNGPVEADARHAIELDPKDGQPWSLLATTQATRGDWQNAVMSATNAIRLGVTDEPEFVAYAMRGWAYVETGQAALALPDLDRALATRPSVLQLLLYRARARIATKQYTGAVADADAILAVRRVPDVYHIRAIAKWYLRQFSDAILDMSRSITVANNSKIARDTANRAIEDLIGEYAHDLHERMKSEGRAALLDELEQVISALESHGFDAQALHAERDKLMSGTDDGLTDRQK